VGAGTLTVVRDQPGIDPYVSQVELVSGEIGDDLASYFLLSDQVPTSVGVGVLVDRDLSVAQAGGFIIQLMPGYTDDVVVMLENNLEGVCSVTDMLEQGMGPNEMLGYLLRDLDYEELEAIPSEFYCGCNEQRALRCVAALGNDEIRDMIASGETAEVYCHFCGRRHYIEPGVLATVLEDDER
jgi:molecular chaperone Hsp33